MQGSSGIPPRRDLPQVPTVAAGVSVSTRESGLFNLPTGANAKQKTLAPSKTGPHVLPESSFAAHNPSQQHNIDPRSGSSGLLNAVMGGSTAIINQDELKRLISKATTLEDALKLIPQGQAGNAARTNPNVIATLISKATTLEDAKAVYNAIPEGPAGDAARTHPNVIAKLMSKATSFDQASEVYNAIPEGNEARTHPNVLAPLIMKHPFNEMNKRYKNITRNNPEMAQKVLDVIVQDIKHNFEFNGSKGVALFEGVLSRDYLFIYQSKEERPNYNDYKNSDFVKDLTRSLIKEVGAKFDISD